MHICLAVYKYGWPISGFYSYFRQLYGRLYRSGIDLTIVCFRRPSIQIPDDPFPVVAIDQPLHPHRAYSIEGVSPIIEPNGEAIQRAISSASEEDDPFDLIHAYHRQDVVIGAMRASDNLGCKFVYSPIGNLRFTEMKLSREMPRNPLRRISRNSREIGRMTSVRLACETADRVIAPSNLVSRQMVTFGASRAKVTRIPFAVDTSAFRPNRQAEVCPAKVVFIGRLDLYQKAVDEALRSFAAAKFDPEDARLVICGDGPHRAELESMAVKLGIEKTTEFTGWINYDVLPEKLSRADVMLLPFKSVEGQSGEGFGRVLAESMALGVPTIATDVPPIEEVIQDGKTGLLSKSRDIDEMSRNLRKVVYDFSLRRRMGLLARERAVRRYSFDVVVSRLSDTYSEICQSV